MLIVHFDAERLQADGLHLGGVADLARFVAAVATPATTSIVDATTTADLLDQFGALRKAGKRFDVVVVVGHSNEERIRLAKDRSATWGEFAEWVRPFNPRRLLLIACRAGTHATAEVLFTRLRHLRRIYATPVTATKDLGALLILAAPYLLTNRRPPRHVVHSAQLAAALATGRQLREWVRTTDKGNERGPDLDALAIALDPLARAANHTLKRIWVHVTHR